MGRIAHFAAGVLMATFGVGIVYAYHVHKQKEFRNFRVVKPGYLYRSGQLTPTGLGRLVEEYGFKTIITLRTRDDSEEHARSNWEEEFCKKNDIVFVRIPARQFWSKEGPPPARKSVARFIEVLSDPEKYPPPILLHCFAGEHRTGAYCAIYRVEFEGWTNEEALAEMRRCGYVNLDREWDVRTFIQLYEPGRQRSEVARQASR